MQRDFTIMLKTEVDTMTQHEDKIEEKRSGFSRLRMAFFALSGLAWAAFLAWTFFPPSAETVERYYSQGLYRWVVGTMTPLTEPFPFSLSLVMVLTIVFGFPLLWVFSWVWLRRKQGRSHWAGLFWGFKWGIPGAGLLLAWVMVLWMAGYQRVPAEIRLGLEENPITDQEADELRDGMFEIILRDMPPAGARDRDGALAAVARAMEEIIEEWDGTPVRLPRRVKATPKGLLLMNGTSGICSPLTLEPHVDGGLPDTAFIMTGAHELGHIAGICGEAEATLIGYVAGLRADDPYARYASALAIYRSLAAQLGRERQQAAMARLPEEAREDLRLAAEAGRKYRIDWLQKASWRTYDKYLQSRGIEDGVKNYGRGVTLFTYAWRKGLVQIEGIPEDTTPEPEDREAVLSSEDPIA